MIGLILLKFYLLQAHPIIVPPHICWPEGESIAAIQGYLCGDVSTPFTIRPWKIFGTPQTE